MALIVLAEELKDRDFSGLEISYDDKDKDWSVVTIPGNQVLVAFDNEDEAVEALAVYVAILLGE